jgi:hypothetical protein
MRLGNTEDSVDEVARWMQTLKPSQRAQLLSLFSHQLTVSVRALCYEGKSSLETVERIRVLNEVHHRVAGYLGHLLLNDEDTGWLKPVAAYLVLCSDEIVKSHIEHAWKHAESVVNRSGPPEPAAAG